MRSQEKGEKEKNKMPTVWFALKRSLHCKSEPSDVYDPKTKSHLSNIIPRKTGRFGCSRSIANLKDVIHGSHRHLEKPPSCSPRSIGSSEFLNPLAHEVILSNSGCELKISGYGGGFSENGGTGGGSNFVGTLNPGTPGPGGQNTMYPHSPPFRNSTTRKSPNLIADKEGYGIGGSAKYGGGGEGSRTKSKASHDVYSNGASITCHKCGEHFGGWGALEAHHLSKHAGKIS